jgi:hypothetical protein
LKIDADGGTDIDPVLEEIMRIGRAEYVYIIISDGITEANSDVLQRFKESGLVKRTRLILISTPILPSSTYYNWVKLLQENHNVEYATNVAKFADAVKKFLSF